ncbi:MAG: glycosyltransferase family 4 protein [Gammaproteobacteria bacterium]|nr:glycosyltransferase family 4 protein [Gammaproteobacteria bacterium]
MGNSLQIGLVGPLPPPSGGMANQTLQLAKLLREEKVQVDVVQTNVAYKPIWIGKIPVIRAFFRLFFYIIKLWSVAGRVDLFHIMANSGWSWHLFTVPAVWIAKLRGVPTVINYRGGEAEKFFSKSFKYVKPTLNASSKIIVPSLFLEKVFSKRGITTQIIANIIDLDRFNARKEQQEKYLPHLLVARNLELIYDNETAIRAFKEILDSYPNAKLTIAGTGPERDNLKSLVQELGIAKQVKFTGRVDTQEMPALYQSADVMLNPSRVDNMPNSILEALASGVPVVSTNVGGIPYMVEHEKTALLVDPEDPVAMASEICRVLEDKRCQQQLVSSGLILVKQFSWSEVSRHWLSLYKMLAA